MLGADAPVGKRDRVVSQRGRRRGGSGRERAQRRRRPRAARARAPPRARSWSRSPATSSRPTPAGIRGVTPTPGLCPSTRPIRAAARRPCAIVRRTRSSTSSARAAPGDFVLQVNHPRSGHNGYFDQLGFDPGDGVGTDPGYDPRFDALEVWNGRNVDARAKVLERLRALLAHGSPRDRDGGHRYARHRRPGGRVPAHVRARRRRRHLGPWDAARTADVVRGVKGLRDVVLTNGPMLRVTANGAPIGGVASRAASTVVKVHVESAPWVVVDEAPRPCRRDGTRAADAAMRQREARPNAEAARMAADASFVAALARGRRRSSSRLRARAPCRPCSGRRGSRRGDRPVGHDGRDLGRRRRRRQGARALGPGRRRSRAHLGEAGAGAMRRSGGSFGAVVARLAPGLTDYGAPLSERPRGVVRGVAQPG